MLFLLCISNDILAQTDSTKAHPIKTSRFPDSVFVNILSIKSEPRDAPNFNIDLKSAFVLYNHLYKTPLSVTFAYGISSTLRFNPNNQFKLSLMHLDGNADDTTHTNKTSMTVYDQAHYLAEAEYTWFFRDKIHSSNYYYETNIAQLHEHQYDDDDKVCIISMEKLQGIDIGYKGIEGITKYSIYQQLPGEYRFTYDAAHKTSELNQQMEDHIISIGYKLESIKHQKLLMEYTNFYHDHTIKTKRETNESITINSFDANLLYSPFIKNQGFTRQQQFIDFNGPFARHLGFFAAFNLRMGGPHFAMNFFYIDGGLWPGFGWCYNFGCVLMDFSLIQRRLFKKAMEYHYNL